MNQNGSPASIRGKAIENEALKLRRSTLKVTAGFTFTQIRFHKRHCCVNFSLNAQTIILCIAKNLFQRFVSYRSEINIVKVQYHTKIKLFPAKIVNNPVF